MKKTKYSFLLIAGEDFIYELESFNLAEYVVKACSVLQAANLLGLEIEICMITCSDGEQVEKLERCIRAGAKDIRFFDRASEIAFYYKDEKEGK